MIACVEFDETVPAVRLMMARVCVVEPTETTFDAPPSVLPCPSATEFVPVLLAPRPMDVSEEPAAAWAPTAVL